ncbi:MAG: GerAB/ArcD/ProY family transporter [Firmicutes bacterium]|nr:GerAB/ArcD/ProY family transporter [Bacillota bacterium]
MTERNKITSRQLGIFILTAQIGFGFLTLPAVLARDTGHDGWLSILAAGIISSLAIIAILLLLRKYAGKSIFEISPRLFGRLPGKAINLFLLLYLSYSMVLSFRVFTEFITLYTLNLTPSLVVALLIITPTAYLLRYGLKPLARFSYFIFLILFFILALVFLVANKIRWTFLMPVGAAGIASLGKSLGTTFIAYIGFELVAFVYPYVEDRENTMKWVLGANFASMAVFTLVFLVTTGLFGENLLKTQLIPLFELARYYRTPFFERTDLLFVLLWFPLVEGVFLTYSFAVYDGLRRIFAIRNRRLFFPLFIAATILFSRIPADLVQTLAAAEVVTIGGIIVVGYLIFCYLFSFVK